MAKFVQLLQKSGVYSSQNFMIVPHDGFNLVALVDAKGFRIEHDQRLDVKEVSFDQVDRIANEYVGKRAGGQEKTDLLARLRTAMYGTISSTARPSRVLKVSPKGAGIPVIKAKRDNIEVRLEVGILRRKEFAIGFKFIKHKGADGAMNPMSKFNPADAEGWINKLNWIFGAQANIYFKLLGADWVHIAWTFKLPMTTEVFKNTLVQYQNGSADLTCFLVGKYKGAEDGVHAAGSQFDKVCVVDDGPHQEIFSDSNYDSFIGVMAHEFGHFVKAAHHDRGPFLMSKQVETCDLDKQIVSDVNAW